MDTPINKFRKSIPKFLLICLYIWAQNNVFAQEPVKIKRINTPVNFDGIPKDEAWKALDKIKLVQNRPNFEADPSEESDIRIGYDDEYLWVGASLFTKDPSSIFMASKKRDEMLFGYDAFGIILDTYNDNQNGLAFFTAPTGLRTDYSISNDASGGGFSFMNFNWNTFWDVKTSKDEKGWYLEMRIPFSSLKFKPNGNIATMGLIITRNISSNNETDTYPAMDPKYGYVATNKPSLAGTVEIEGAKPSKPIYISPYIIGGLSYDWLRNETETKYVKNNPYPNRTANAGLDVKYNVNSNLTLDLTANTDFAQVEADNQQVNLTRYSLFFPEKRMFFQERSDLFDFSLGGFSDNLFYSRNIGISNGEPIRIYGGARLTGKLGKCDMGFFDMQTAEQDETPGENFGVLRMKRQVINPNSYIGGILTSRIGMNGNKNFAYGVDGNFHLFGDDYLNVKWSQTSDSKIENKMNSLDPSFILVDWERRSQKGFGYKLDYTYSGRKFNPVVGFIMRNGVQGLSGQALYGWIPGEKSKLFNYNFNVRGESYTRLDDGKFESLMISPGFELSTKKGNFCEAGFELQKEGVLNDFNLSDSIKILAGDYSFIGSRFDFGTSNAKRIFLMSNVELGQFYDGNKLGVRTEINFNLSSSLNLSTMYEFNAIRFPERETNNSLNIHSVNMKALYMLNTKVSASLLVQYVNTQKDLITNFRLRYNPKEGNDFYLVYNDYRGTGNLTTIPETPRFFDKTFMVKFIHTFIL